MNSNQIKKIKYNRLKPEERFLIDIFDGLIKEESLIHKGVFLYIKDNYCYFYHDTKNNTLYYDFYRIWRIFQTEFKDKNQQTNIFVKIMVEKHLKLERIITMSEFANQWSMIEKHLITRPQLCNYYRR